MPGLAGYWELAETNKQGRLRSSPFQGSELRRTNGGMLMGNKENASVATTGQVLELASLIVRNMPKDIPAELAQDFIQNPGKLKSRLSEIFIPAQKISVLEDISDLLADWKKLYKEVFGIDVDFSNLHVPEYQKGFDRLIVVAQGMKPQMLYDKCAKLFTCWKWTDKGFDEVMEESDRTAELGHYAVWFRDRVEADEELKYKSANMLKEEGIPGITLEERFLYELKYFKETGNHLDIKNVTYCSGSRYSDGNVPLVDWSDDRLKVFRYGPVYRDGLMRTRAAVILEA